MATPLLDAQILRLRRRIGDMYNEDGTLIDASNVYTSTSGVTWKQQELLDIYNDAIKSFMIYLVKAFPKAIWWEFLPGYVVIKTDVSLSATGLVLSDLSPTAFQLIDVKLGGLNSDLPKNLATFISPDQWFDTKVGFVKTRKPDSSHYFYTVFADGDTAGAPPTMFFLPDGQEFIDIIYLKDHLDLVQNSATDLGGISQDGLRRILMFAEAEARRWKSTEAAAVPEAQLQQMMQMDSNKTKGA